MTQNTTHSPHQEFKNSAPSWLALAPERNTHLGHRLLQHQDRAVHLALLLRRQLGPCAVITAVDFCSTVEPVPHPVAHVEQLLRPRRQRRTAQRARLRHALLAQLLHAFAAERVLAWQFDGIDRRLQADQALVRLRRLLGLAVELRLRNRRDDMRLAGLLVPWPVLLWKEGAAKGEEGGWRMDGLKN